jgi:hypothetical protein
LPNPCKSCCRCPGTRRGAPGRESSREQQQQQQQQCGGTLVFGRPCAPLMTTASEYGTGDFTQWVIPTAAGVSYLNPVWLRCRRDTAVLPTREATSPWGLCFPQVLYWECVAWLLGWCCINQSGPGQGRQAPCSEPSAIRVCHESVSGSGSSTAHRVRLDCPVFCRHRCCHLRSCFGTARGTGASIPNKSSTVAARCRVQRRHRPGWHLLPAHHKQRTAGSECCCKHTTPCMQTMSLGALLLTSNRCVAHETTHLLPHS